jgi:Domain of unknown function (DUF4214)
VSRPVLDLPRRALEAGDLLFGEDHDFVVSLYLALLRRWPDPGGYHHYREMVANRPERRIDAIRQMAGSEEARRAGAAIAIPASGPVLPSDPRRAMAAALELRTAWLRDQVMELREAVELLGGPGGPELAGLGAELIAARDAELRSEINALRREMGERMDALLELLRRHGVPVPAAERPATPEERAAAAVSRLVADYVGDLLAITEARFEARLRAVEARLLARNAGPSPDQPGA